MPECKLCGKVFKNLSLHLQRSHFVSVEEYKRKFRLWKPSAIIDKDLWLPELIRKKQEAIERGKKISDLTGADLIQRLLTKVPGEYEAFCELCQFYKKKYFVNTWGENIDRWYLMIALFRIRNLLKELEKKG